MRNRDRHSRPNADEQMIDALMQLAAACHAQELTDAEAKQLNGLLEESETARQIFLQLATDTQSLRAWAAAQSKHRAGSALSAMPASGGPNDLRMRPKKTPHSLFTRSVVTLVASVLCVFLIGAMIWLVRSSSPLTPADRLDPAIANRPAEMPSGAQSLHLDSGTAKLTLGNVGYVIAEGPAEFDLLGPKRARLNYGRIKMRVTEQTGRGFVIETPDGDVTDLGTEFGLNVSRGQRTGLVVFEGSVDLRVAEAQPTESARVERLIGGEAVEFNKGGKLDRLVSIMTGKSATFCSSGDNQSDYPDSVITNVADELRTADTRNFYEIVPRGFGEDSLAYADRPKHEWNGTTKKGIPDHLIGADYIKTFSDDELRRDVKIRVTLSRPAKLYVFFDDRMKPPNWLRKNFRKTTDKLGMDLGEWSGMTHPQANAEGPGNSIDHSFTIWGRVCKNPGTVVLGANGTHDLRDKRTKIPYMYGIAAIALASSASPSETASSPQPIGADLANEISSDDAGGSTESKPSANESSGDQPTNNKPTDKPPVASRITTESGTSDPVSNDAGKSESSKTDFGNNERE